MLAHLSVDEERKIAKVVRICNEVHKCHRYDNYKFQAKNMLCFCAHLFIYALWSPAGKGLTSWLSFVMSNCEVVTFQLVSWVRSGA